MRSVLERSILAAAVLVRNMKATIYRHDSHNAQFTLILSQFGEHNSQSLLMLSLTSASSDWHR
jgi:hypothetical protein